MSDLLTGVSERLVRDGLRLAVAESCTGGLLAARLTAPAGASRYFVAGFVTYANGAKEAMLGVRSETLAAYGAVSEQVAREMALGARRASGAEAALAITGIAGPDGGTAEKPVGTVWIAASLAGRSEARRFQFEGSRSAVREASALAALEMLGAMLDEASA